MPPELTLPDHFPAVFDESVAADGAFSDGFNEGFQI